MLKKRPIHKLFFCLLFSLISFSVLAQTKVTGRVTDEKGLPLPGANVIVKGTKNATNTDNNGNYSITGINSNDVLVFTMVGLIKQEVAVKGRSVINVTLVDDQRVLNEVVVIGYGTQKRRDVTGAVASIKGDVFKDQPITNPLAGLQGRTPGVEVVENSGAPDAQPTLIIRGLSSLNQPTPLYIVDGIRSQDVSTINPQDIASIDVLKDASAAAIYGASAAGGVIIITTKKGSGDQPSINFSTRYGVTKPKLVQLLDKNGFIALENIVNPNVFKGATRLDTLSNTDWVNALYRNGTEQNYNLSITGSTPVVSYLVSGFYNAQTGIFIKNYSNIGGARVNTDYKLFDGAVKIGEQLGLSQRITSPLIGSQADLHNAPFRTQPIIPIYDKNGNYGIEPTGYTGLNFSGPNPYGAVQSADAQNTKDNVQANVYVEIRLPFHLSFRTNFGYSFYNETQDYLQNAYNFGPVAQSTNSLTRYAVNSSQLLSNYVLSYDQTFDKHHINAIAGYEQIVNKYENIMSSETSIGLPGYSYVQTSNSELALSGKYDPNGLIKSQFARINYNYNSRYYLSASVRQDANFIIFGPNNPRGVFPAGSVGWNISEEPFFKNLVPAISLLKLRGSYGTLGNSSIPPYSYTASYGQFNTNGGLASGGQNFAPGAPLIIANSTNSISNPNVEWETIHETNIGIDGEALGGKLYFTLDWYNKNTEKMLYNLQLAPSTGFTQPYYTNIGGVNNKGFEVLLGFRSKVGKFGYDISANASFNKNTVTNLSGVATDALYDGYAYYSNGDAGFNMMSNQHVTITKAGLPFGSFYGYKVLGIFATDAQASSQIVNGNTAHAGDLIFEDVDHNGKINSADQQVIGNPNPKLVYGINMHFNYKGFDLALLFNGVAGVQLFNGVKAYEQYPFSDGNTTNKVFGDSFLNGNGLTSQPRLGLPVTGGFTLDPNQNYTSVNSYFVENGDYLKLKNVQLGYTFNGKALEKIRIKSARLFVMANNVFTITKYSGLDPELGNSFTTSGYGGTTTRGIDAVSQYPQTRIYSAGLDINF